MSKSGKTSVLKTEVAGSNPAPGALDLALFEIEQDLMDLEEEILYTNPVIAKKVLVIAEKVRDLQDG